MRQIVRNYEAITPFSAPDFPPSGYSALSKEVVFHILGDNSQQIEVLDIGFGVGNLGATIKMNAAI